MRLVLRLILAFGLLAVLSTAGLGWVVRTDRRQAETARFEKEVRQACKGVVQELERQAESDRRVVAGACQSGELVDRIAVGIERGEDLGMQLGYRELVPRQRVAFGLDELMLATSAGDVIGADPQAFFGSPRADVERALQGDTTHFSLRTEGRAAIVARCVRKVPGGRAVGFVGAHHVSPLLERLGKVLDVKVGMGALMVTEHIASAPCTFSDASGNSIPILVSKPKTQLYENLRQIDQAVFGAAILSAGAGLILAILLGRSLGRPIAELAEEAKKVAADQARPIKVRGSGEIADLTRAFDKMLEDLAQTRRRLAATSRVAAWREVARRVAHEIKNPLAPIRAAVETLRRLRARNDPAFDEYFDEATRTVLDEVHRISNIVTEFTRFARLPAPNPQELDVEEMVRHVVQLHKPNDGRIRLSYAMARRPLTIRADRDQLVQVLTNLVQNALDSVKNQASGEITVYTSPDEHGYLAISVTDNGPGIAPEIAARLFEPYATTKASGTGLGLAIAQRIAIEHNGELSYLGTGNGARGAVFRLLVPVDGTPPMSEATPPPSD